MQQKRKIRGVFCKRGERGLTRVAGEVTDIWSCGSGRRRGNGSEAAGEGAEGTESVL